MKARDHEREVRKLMEAHQSERRLLLDRIAQLETTVETLTENVEKLRARAQAAERKAVHLEDMLYEWPD